MKRKPALPAKPEFSHRITFDGDSGGREWKSAVRYYEEAERMLRPFVEPAPTSNVVSIRYLSGSPKSFEDYLQRREMFRAQAVRLLAVEAPNVRELANKIRLAAYIEGLSDPLHFTHADSKFGTSLERVFGGLARDAIRLEGRKRGAAQ